MLIKYIDLLPGDKIKFKEEYLNKYCCNEDKRLVFNKVLTIKKITNIYEDAIKFIFEEIGDWTYLIRDTNYIEIIELSENN